MDKYKDIEKSIITTYKKKIWVKFVKAINEFQMINKGDKIAVCMSGGKDSFLLAKCFQELKRHNKIDFDLVFLVMNPGYSKENLKKIKENAKLLNIPIEIFETDIFTRVNNIEENPCYLCARMRRGYLYIKAKELGCNKIALGHHMDDVIETVLMGMFYGAQFQTMMPKLKSSVHENMELIRPLYYVKEEDIIRWKNRNELSFLQCACKITEKNGLSENDVMESKREEMKRLIKSLRKTYKNIDINILRSTRNVNLNTVISYVKNGKTYSVMDNFIEEERKE